MFGLPRVIPSSSFQPSAVELLLHATLSGSLHTPSHKSLPFAMTDGGLTMRRAEALLRNPSTRIVASISRRGIASPRISLARGQTLTRRTMQFTLCILYIVWIAVLSIDVYTSWLLLVS